MTLKEHFRNIQKLPDWIYKLPVALVFLFFRCKRIRIVDPKGILQAKNPPLIVNAWHNRLFAFPFIFPKWHREHTSAVISASRDGQYIADIARAAGVGSIRGSSKKNGLNVLLETARVLKEEKRYICFTPDGPRGPRYHMNIGPVYLASTEGVPLLPIGITYSAYWELSSWDGFRIPKPWAKVSLVFGDLIHVPPDLSPEELEKWRVIAEEKLNLCSGVTEEEKIRAAESERLRLARRAAKKAAKEKRKS